jgi:hypothetical protein
VVLNQFPRHNPLGFFLRLPGGITLHPLLTEIFGLPEDSEALRLEELARKAGVWKIEESERRTDDP